MKTDKTREARGPHEEARRFLLAGGVVAVTGAGISQESGIPTFRGKGGLWETYPPEEFATPDGLMRLYEKNPARLFKFASEFYKILIEAVPNAAHVRLAAMEASGLLDAVVTQNIDDLHRRAGSRNVMELHGNAFRLRCQACQTTVVLSPGEVGRWFLDLKGFRPLAKFFRRCPCGNRSRIDIVLFGELLPPDAWQKARQAVERAKTVLLVGTSGAVYPAASLPVLARELGKNIVEINAETSPFSELADAVALGRAAQILEELLAA